MRMGIALAIAGAVSLSLGATSLDWADVDVTVTVTCNADRTFTYDVTPDPVSVRAQDSPGDEVDQLSWVLVTNSQSNQLVIRPKPGPENTPGPWPFGARVHNAVEGRAVAGTPMNGNSGRTFAYEIQTLCQLPGGVTFPAPIDPEIIIP